jgi:preprotein translocase subunit YajC
MEIISQLLPFIFLIAIMYFVIIRPQQKEAKQSKEMISALAKGDKVVTKESVSRKYEDEA